MIEYSAWRPAGRAPTRQTPALTGAARLTTSNVSSSHQAGGRIELVNTLKGWHSFRWIGAAGTMPPVGNLRRFIAERADLVAFSGGKLVRGPAASGFLAGRRRLIRAATIQDQDASFTRTSINRPSPSKGPIAWPSRRIRASAACSRWAARRSPA